MISDGWFRPKERDADEMNSDLKASDTDVLSKETVTSPTLALNNEEKPSPLPQDI